MQDAPLVSADDLNRVIGLLKATFSHLVFDLSKSYSELDMVAMRAADHVLLVTQLDLPCLRNVVRLLTSFDEVEGLKDKIKIVVNRVGLENGQISMKKAEETIGREIFWRLPNDYRIMADVRNNGVPLIEAAPRAALTQSLIGLADALAGAETTGEEETVSPRVGRWLSFWPGRSRSKTESGS